MFIQCYPLILIILCRYERVAATSHKPAVQHHDLFDVSPFFTLHSSIPIFCSASFPFLLLIQKEMMDFIRMPKPDVTTLDFFIINWMAHMYGHGVSPQWKAMIEAGKRA